MFWAGFEKKAVSKEWLLARAQGGLRSRFAHMTPGEKNVNGVLAGMSLANLGKGRQALSQGVSRLNSLTKRWKAQPS
jgi:hypothetical protein